MNQSRHSAPAQLFEDAVRAIPSFVFDDEFLIDIAVRVAAESLGDAAYYLRVVNCQELEGVKYFHRDLGRHLATTRLIGKRTSVELVDAYRKVLDDGEPLIIDGSEVERMRSDATVAHEEFTAAVRIRAAALAPVVVAGAPVGLLGLLRESSHQVRTVEVRDLMALAESLGDLLTLSAIEQVS